MSSVQSNVVEGSVSSVVSSDNSVVSSHQRTNKRRRCCASTISGKKCKMFSLKEDSFEHKKYCTHHDKKNKISDIVAINNSNKWVDLIINVIFFVYYMICLYIIYSNTYQTVNFLEPYLFKTDFLKNDDNYCEIMKSSSFIYLYDFNLQLTPFSFECLNQTF